MQKYSLYPPAFEFIARDYRKAAKLPKKTPLLKSFGLSFDLIDQYHSANMVGILMNELLWNRSNRRVVFPESSTLITRLLDAAAEVKDARGLVLPFDSFMLATPEGMSYQGTRINPIIANTVKIEDINKTHIPMLLKESGIKSEIPFFRFDSSIQKSRLFYILQYSSLGRPFLYLFLEDDIPALLAAKNFRDALRCSRFNYDESNDNVAYQDTELHEQFLAIKLICSLGIYHQATEHQYLVDGLPSDGPPRQIVAGGSWPKDLHSLTLKSPKVNRDDPEMHVRNWHFRQLRHEKYYRASYASYAPGSRWTFVSPSLVGRASAHTLLEK